MFVPPTRGPESTLFSCTKAITCQTRSGDPPETRFIEIVMYIIVNTGIYPAPYGLAWGCSHGKFYSYLTLEYPEDTEGQEFLLCATLQSYILIQTTLWTLDTWDQS